MDGRWEGRRGTASIWSQFPMAPKLRSGKPRSGQTIDAFRPRRCLTGHAALPALTERPALHNLQAGACARAIVAVGESASRSPVALQYCQTVPDAHVHGVLPADRRGHVQLIDVS